MIRNAIVYHKQLGDTLLLQPVIEELAGMGSPVDVFTLQGHEPLVRLMPGASWGADATGKKHDYQRVIAFDQGSKSVMRALRLKAKDRYLVARTDLYLKWHHHFLFDACLTEGLCVRYVARYYHDMLFGASAGSEFKPPRLHLPPPDWRQGAAQRFGVLINPVSGWERKCWTVEGWRKVIQTILDMKLGPVGVTGGGVDWHQAICRDICAGFPATDVVNVAGKTTLEAFLVMLADAPLVLTVDGAASHIAQAFGKPTVVLFGPSKPQMWHFETPQNRAIHAVEHSDQDFGPVAHLPTEILPPTSLIPPERVIQEMQRVLSAAK